MGTYRIFLSHSTGGTLFSSLNLKTSNDNMQKETTKGKQIKPHLLGVSDNFFPIAYLQYSHMEK